MTSNDFLGDFLDNRLWKIIIIEYLMDVHLVFVAS